MQILENMLNRSISDWSRTSKLCISFQRNLVLGWRKNSAIGLPMIVLGWRKNSAIGFLLLSFEVIQNLVGV